MFITHALHLNGNRDACQHDDLADARPEALTIGVEAESGLRVVVRAPLEDYVGGLCLVYKEVVEGLTGTAAVTQAVKPDSAPKVQEVRPVQVIGWEFLVDAVHSTTSKCVPLREASQQGDAVTLHWRAFSGP